MECQRFLKIFILLRLIPGGKNIRLQKQIRRQLLVFLAQLLEHILAKGARPAKDVRHVKLILVLKGCDRAVGFCQLLGEIRFQPSVYGLTVRGFSQNCIAYSFGTVHSGISFVYSVFGFIGTRRIIAHIPGCGK